MTRCAPVGDRDLSRPGGSHSLELEIMHLSSIQRLGESQAPTDFSNLSFTKRNSPPVLKLIALFSADGG
jgi:hypothetical protein